MLSPGSEAPVLRLRNIPVCECTTFSLSILSTDACEGFSLWLQLLGRAGGEGSGAPTPATGSSYWGVSFPEESRLALPRPASPDGPWDTLPAFPISQWLQLLLCVVSPVQTSLFMRSF